jgi:erythromycin esterase
VEVKINGKVYGNDDPDFKAPTGREIQLLNEKAVPFEIGESESDNIVFKPLSAMVKDARIVALGENSHGSSSIYMLKLRMIKYLVKEEGFSIFALEMPTVEADYINEYVLEGKGSLEQVIANLTYPSWQTKEMIEIIEWIRTHNLKANQKVEFHGFDMQDGSAALAAIKIFIEKHDDKLSAKINEIENLYKQSMETGNFSNSLFKKAQYVEQYINSDNYPDIQESAIVRMNHYMNIFVQSLAFNFQIESAKSRDEYMAENVSWILENSGKKNRIIVSGDNTHITEAGGKMGTPLSVRYKENYISIAFTYNTGTYSAYGPKAFYDVHPSYIGTYEYYFSKSKHRNFLLDLREVDDIPILNQKNGFRSIGSRPQETTQFYEIDIKDHFDVVVYLERSNHTEPAKQ